MLISADYLNSERLKADSLLRSGKKFAFRATIKDVCPSEKGEPRFAKKENYVIPPAETVIFGDHICLSTGGAHLLKQLGRTLSCVISTPADFIAASQLVRRNLARVASKDCKIICEIADAGLTACKMTSLDGRSWKRSKIEEYKTLLEQHGIHFSNENLRYGTLSQTKLPLLLELLPSQHRRIVNSALGNFGKAGYEAVRVINDQIVFAWNMHIVSPLARSRNELFMEIRSKLIEIDDVSKFDSQEMALNELIRRLDAQTSAAQHLDIAKRFLAEIRAFLKAVDQVAMAPLPAAKLYVLS